ncbi:MAG: putative ABC transporter permease [Evtepia sp.]
MITQLYELACFFFIYAFLGWCAEVVFHALTFGKFINRGFLNGPICPIYGIGVVLVLLLLDPFQKYGLVLFLASVLLTSLLEFLTGLALEKIFHATWWDYSDQPFHFGRYVCLKFSLMWGFGCVFIVRIFQPFIIFLIGLMPQIVGVILLSILTLGFAVDLCATILSVRAISKRLDVLQELATEIHALSDHIGEKLSDSALNAAERNRQTMERLEAKRAEFETKLSENPISHRRILKAFPGMKSKRHQNALEELKKVLHPGKKD